MRVFVCVSLYVCPHMCVSIFRTRAARNICVDGSLRNVEWYSKVLSLSLSLSLSLCVCVCVCVCLCVCVCDHTRMLEDQTPGSTET